MLKMNKNIILFIILLGALGVTYWFEERGNIQSQKEESSKVEILNADKLGELQGVRGIKIDFLKQGELYYSRDKHIPLAKNRIDEFFKILAGVKVKTFLKNEDVQKVGRSFYIPDDALSLSFQFEKGEMSFTLGKKLSFDQTFYMEVIKEGRKQIVIAEDESPDPGVYQNDKDYQRSEAKFKRLQIIFMLTNVYFYDTRLFKDLYPDDKSIHFDEMTISTFRNKKYVLSFKETKTIPPLPSGLDYFEENWLSFHQALSRLEGRTVIAPFEESALSEILSHFDIIDRSGRRISLSLYKKFGDQNGYFLTSSLEKVLFVLKPEDARYFFVNVQDFWHKSLGPKGKDYQLGISFYDNKKEEVSVSDKELFKVTSQIKGITPRALEFKKLIDFLKMEGDHVSELNEKPSEILKKSIIRVNFENRSLSVILEENDAILVDIDHKIKIHHYVGATLPFSIKRTDYFE